jgi:hypothetical protein
MGQRSAQRIKVILGYALTYGDINRERQGLAKGTFSSLQVLF